MTLPGLSVGRHRAFLSTNDKACLGCCGEQVNVCNMGIFLNETGHAAWSATTTYAEGDVVTYQSLTWRSRAAGNLNHTPPTATSALYGSGRSSIDRLLCWELPFNNYWELYSRRNLYNWNSEVAYPQWDSTQCLPGILYNGYGYRARIPNTNKPPSGGATDNSEWAVIRRNYPTGAAQSFAAVGTYNSVPPYGGEDASPSCYTVTLGFNGRGEGYWADVLAKYTNTQWQIPAWCADTTGLFQDEPDGGLFSGNRHCGGGFTYIDPLGVLRDGFAGYYASQERLDVGVHDTMIPVSTITRHPTHSLVINLSESGGLNISTHYSSAGYCVGWFSATFHPANVYGTLANTLTVPIGPYIGCSVAGIGGYCSFRPGCAIPEWSATETYEVGDQVAWKGYFYECNTAHGPSQEPPNALYWVLI